MKTLRTLVLIAAAALSAQANIVVELQVAGVAPSTENAGAYTWTYDAYLSNNDLINNDFFAVYDFGGFIEFISAPEFWTPMTRQLGPIAVTEFDDQPDSYTDAPDRGALNLVWTYTGATLSAEDDDIYLGQFVADSRYGQRMQGWYVAQTSNPIEGNVGNVDVPQVPEPSTYMLLGGGLASLVAIKRRRAA